MTVITQTDDTLGGEPRLEGTRISVRHVVKLVREGDRDTETAADELGIDPIDVTRCLDYYDTHTVEMQAYEARDESRLEAVRAESRAPEA